MYSYFLEIGLILPLVMYVNVFNLHSGLLGTRVVDVAISEIKVASTAARREVELMTRSLSF